jgi:hypothetical protein
VPIYIYLNELAKVGDVRKFTGAVSLKKQGVTFK